MPFPPVHPGLDRALAERGYAEPTPVQEAVLKPETLGRDLLVSAQTGSGKTVAFGLALAPELLGEAERFAPAAEPMALAVAPTRELALQVHRELGWLYANTGARLASCVGGMDMRREQRALSQGVHIVVGTPGRLRDHIERGSLDLSKLKAVVLDEADEMLDMGFREDLEFILEAAPAERRSLLFSATIPREIASLAKRYQRDAVRIAAGAQNQQHADIEYRAVRVAPNEVERAVVNVLRFFEARGALVFCGTRENVRHLHANLMERGFDAVALSGELSQAERNRAMQALRDGRARVCIATDVAARGIDLPDLQLVIHADLPQSHETLLHRSGRTGRAGRKGTSVLVVPYTRARKAERLLYSAHVEALWTSAPSVEQIKVRDQERLTQEVSASVEAEVAEEDRAAAQALLAERSPEEIAAALVRLHRARLPAPEEIYDGGPPAERADRDRGPARPPRERQSADRGERGGDYERAPRGGYERAPRRGDDYEPRPPSRDGYGGEAGPAAGDDVGRPTAPAVGDGGGDGAEAVWFRMNVGRSNQADPRWLIPLICRRGHVTKQDIGDIRIFDRETRFEIAGHAAERFADAAGKADDRDEGVRIEAARPERGAAGTAATAAPRDRREVIRLPRRGGASDRIPGAAPRTRGPRVGGPPRVGRGTA